MPNPKLRGAATLVVTAVLFSGATFGFFFAWVCSTLWGLDAIDPRTAIEAMNGMNASVRNPVFFTAFFVTPFVAAAAALACLAVRGKASALLLVAAAVVHAGGVILFTAMFNVPLNEALAAGGVPSSIDEARRVWDAYSGQWQAYNLIRTVAGGLALALTAAALFLLGRRGTVAGLGRASLAAPAAMAEPVGTQRPLA